MATAATKESVMEALREVMDPELALNLVDLGMIRDVSVEGVTVRLTMAVTTMVCPLKAYMARAARETVAALPGVEDVQVETVEMTDEDRRRMIRAALVAASERTGAGVWQPWRLVGPGTLVRHRHGAPMAEVRRVIREADSGAGR